MGKPKIIGNSHFRETFYAIPEWSNGECETAFRYKGEVYFLSEFMAVRRNAPEWLQSFDGYHSDSFFSGILIRFDPNDNDDYIQVYTYIA